MSVQALASVTQICCCLWEERDRRANQRLDLRWSDNRYTGFLIGEVKATGVLVSYVDYNIRPQGQCRRYFLVTLMQTFIFRNCFRLYCTHQA
jgi:hypothetical protein